MTRTRTTAPPIVALAVAAVLFSARGSLGQGPTIDLGPLRPLPGGENSLLGRAPGSGGAGIGDVPGADQQTIGGRAGPSVPRVPPSVFSPGTRQNVQPGGVIAPTPVLPIAELPIYGSLDIPRGGEEEGPADGLTLDAAIERLVRENLDLRAQSFELPQADADILTASLRANPIFYADTQLVPYGQYSRDRPGGQTQYDVNISYPLDLSRKRRARTEVARRAKNVLEASYQNSVRLQIDNLYTAYVDVLAARETVRFAKASVAGLERATSAAEKQFQARAIYEAQLTSVRLQLETARLGLADSERSLRKATQTLAALLAMGPSETMALEVRGSIRDTAPEPPATDALVRIAMENRPDLISYRLGVQRANADVKLAYANRFADVYVLYQPYTFQNNAPIGLKSPTSWALGATIPLPIYNRNQGNIQRAKLNVSQTQTELAALERSVVAEVTRAEEEYRVTREAVQQLETRIVPEARSVLDTARIRLERGQENIFYLLDALRSFNDIVRQYRDSLVRHRRAMLDLNTAVGRRLLP